VNLQDSTESAAAPQRRTTAQLTPLAVLFNRYPDDLDSDAARHSSPLRPPVMIYVRLERAGQRKHLRPPSSDASSKVNRGQLSGHPGGKGPFLSANRRSSARAAGRLQPPARPQGGPSGGCAGSPRAARAFRWSGGSRRSTASKASGRLLLSRRGRAAGPRPQRVAAPPAAAGALEEVKRRSARRRNVRALAFLSARPVRGSRPARDVADRGLLGINCTHLRLLV
jgi:hypothetical protein